MLLADSNIWLALAFTEHVFHSPARMWFAGLQSGNSVCFCRSTQQSFLRLMTTRAILAPFGIPPLRNKSAWSTYERFRGDRRVGWLHEPRGLDAVWKRLAARPQVSPKMWMDAYLAAFAISGGHQLVTTDHAFNQFKDLDLHVITNE